MATNYNELFKVRNVAGGIVVIGAFKLDDGNERLVNPAKFSTGAIDTIKAYVDRGYLEASNDVADLIKLEEYADIVAAVDVKSANGKDFTVFGGHAEKEQYKPKRTGVIQVSALETGKALEVKSIDTVQKATGVTEEVFDIEEAKELLGLHWKTLEKRVAELTNVTNIEYILTVAKNAELGEKKVEILEARLAELKA